MIGTKSRVVAESFALSNGSTVDLGDGVRLTAVGGDIIRTGSTSAFTAGEGVRLISIRVWETATSWAEYSM